MDKPKLGWEMLCEHANEVPNVCPCPSTCGCKYYSCRPKVIPISDKSKSCYSWSPDQCVTQFLDEIRSGKIEPTKIMILWFDEAKDGGLHPHSWFSQIDKFEGIALLELIKNQEMDDWRRK